MAFDDPSVDADLRETLAAHEIVLGKEWADGQPALAWPVTLRATGAWNNA